MIRRALALFILVAISPLFVGLAFSIFITQGRPIFFVSSRIGMNETSFNFVKFRTLIEDAPLIPSEDLDFCRYQKTVLGRYLRLSKLDELPNLINVIKGDMNFIGYRPGLSSQAALTRQRREFDVYSDKPGITGLAQIKGGSGMMLRRKARYDRFWIKRNGFGKLKLAIFILVNTIPFSSFFK